MFPLDEKLLISLGGYHSNIDENFTNVRFKYAIELQSYEISYNLGSIHKPSLQWSDGAKAGFLLPRLFEMVPEAEIGILNDPPADYFRSHTLFLLPRLSCIGNFGTTDL